MGHNAPRRLKSSRDEHPGRFLPTYRNPELAKGVNRFCIGLAKKALLANPCGELADTMLLADTALSAPDSIADCMSYLSSLSVMGAWVGIIAYALHIYLDFSAYSDMAIGMGEMIGLRYPENFRYPYIAKSVTDFWRRWHITLSTFFRDYVYIPMGGSRCSWPRMALNTLVVWALTGLWHGASWNYVLWGLWFYVFLMAERLFSLKDRFEKSRVFSHLYLLGVVCLGWVLFRFCNLELGLIMAKTLFGVNGNPLTSFTDTVQLQTNSLLLIAALIASTPIASIARKKAEALAETNAVWQRIWQAVFYGAIPVVLLLSSATLVGDSYNPFLYFQF